MSTDMKNLKKEMVYISQMNYKPEIPTHRKCTWRESLEGNLVCPHTKEIWKQGDNSKPHKDILSVIGNTPLVKLNKIPKDEGVTCNIYAKCEFLNPGGSIKDRIIKRMVEDYEKQGILKPGMTLLEATSGNTGIAIALVAAVKGYKCILVMSEKSSPEKEAIIKSLGAKVVRTSVEQPSAPGGPFDTVLKLRQEIPNSIILDQMSNPGNPLAHYDITAEEIFSQMGDQKINLLVLPVGTGGTITGIGRKFKEKSPETKIIGIDAEGSNLAYPPELNKSDVTFFEVEGIGFEMPTASLDQSVCDEWFKTNDHDSFIMARRIMKEEGLLVGASSGASLYAAIALAKKYNLQEGDNILIEFTDGIRNYLSKFLSDQWMESKGFLPSENTQNLWWWDNKVEKLSLKSPIIVNIKSSFKKVINVLKMYNHKGALVSDSQGNTIGTVCLQDLNTRLLKSLSRPEDSIEKCVIKNGPKVELDSKLGRLSRIFEKESIVPVVKEDNPIALVEIDDLFKYTLKMNTSSEGIWSKFCCSGSSNKY